MLDRNITKDLISQNNFHYITILIGSRQVGKSTLLQMVQDELKQEASFYNLENPLHLSLINEGYSALIQRTKTKLIFIDEFQYCKNISSIFKAIYDLNPDIKIYASGSSSLEIQKYLKESLAGRKKERIIYPLSFNEWLKQFDNNFSETISAKEPVSIDLHEELLKHLPDFLRFGGLPGLLHCDSEIEKKEYLFGIYKTYIAKDIKSFLKEESVTAFNKLITYLAVNNGGLLKKDTLCTISGISSRQVDRHIEVMQGTFVLYLLPPLSTNKGKEITKMPKFYLYDQGVINAIIQDFRHLNLRRDIGVVREQFVYQELIKTININYKLRFWRTSDGSEVDFVLEKDKQYLPIEVKTNWPDNKIPTGLKRFFEYYPETKQAVILTDSSEKSFKYKGITIYKLPLYKACRLLELL